jgi:uncharacterized protein (DUF1697 family)
MTRYVAFLRGINVSGQKIIPMKQLQQIFEVLPIKNVATYIQSGNVIFDSASSSMDMLTTKIERHLKKELGYEVTVLLRTINDLANLIGSEPFEGKVEVGKSKPYITFISEEPKPKLQLPYISKKKEITIIAAEKLNLCSLSHPLPNGTWGFPNAIIEKDFKVKATTRNLNTVTTIVKKYAD